MALSEFGAGRALLEKLKAVWRELLPGQYRVHRGSYLPPRDSRMGGIEYEDDDFFLDSSLSEADRVIGTLAAKPTDHLLDIGCGHGRLPIGLIHRSFALRYLGIDVKLDSIMWCTKYIHQRHPGFRFQHVDVVNERYNPGGAPLSPEYRLPADTGSVDIVYMWGVFTNMEPGHLPTYVKEFVRVLRPGGRAFLTAHVEERVPESSVNPENYTPYACSGPLHAVRYERGYFFDTFRQAGLALTRFDYHLAGNCQSEVYFVKE